MLPPSNENKHNFSNLKLKNLTEKIAMLFETEETSLRILNRLCSPSFATVAHELDFSRRCLQTQYLLEEGYRYPQCRLLFALLPTGRR